MTSHRADRPQDARQDADQELDGYTGETHLVRRPWTWVSEALLVVGVGVLGLGLSLPQAEVIVAGGVLLAAGAGLAWWSGLFWDVHTSGHPLPEHDGERRVPGPSARRDAPDAQARAARVEQRHDRIVEERASVRGNWVRAGGLVLLAAGLWLSLSQGPMYAETPGGREGTWRAMGGGIVVTLLAVRVLAARRSRLPVLVGPPVALLLILGGLLGAGTDRATVSELVSGVVVLLGSLLTLDRRHPGPVGPAAGHDGR